MSLWLLWSGRWWQKVFDSRAVDSLMRSGVRIMKSIILADGWRARVSYAGSLEQVNTFKTKLTDVAVVRAIRAVGMEDHEREQSVSWHCSFVVCRFAWQAVVGGRRHGV